MSRLAFLLAAAAVAALGFAAGWLAKGPGPGVFHFDASAAAYQAAGSPAGLSKGGFTGFAETGGLDGMTIVAGKVTKVASGVLTLATSGGENTVRLSGEDKVRVLAPFTASPPPGVTAVVSLVPASGEARAVLLIIDP
jgi:hypothetical protein